MHTCMARREPEAAPVCHLLLQLMGSPPDYHEELVQVFHVALVATTVRRRIWTAAIDSLPGTAGCSLALRNSLHCV
eukprot:CAMPEP_0181514022 /NCGR_PEP_ID=MMETSP1110-20121109/62811_1 /TAXON_ID=174948 /ORGANISM="Symbiodinium sp., Strain CCMP421" /LENGTH=75 /DNA_ID=CAMNT_0023643929 /DNA_START=55 /DNA_END=279 /DNA_ORIENTATION=-